MSRPITVAGVASASDAAGHLHRSPNTRAAVFLGAGASKTFGYLLTRELLPEIFRELRNAEFLSGYDTGAASSARRSRRLLKEYLRQLLPGKSLRRGNLPLVTSLLSIIDYSIATGQLLLPERSLTQTREARRLLERAILEVLGEDEDFTDESWDALVEMSRMVSTLRKRTPGAPLALITTNYDRAADVIAFESTGVISDNEDWDADSVARKVDFGFGWMDAKNVDPPHYHPRPTSPAVELLKLHGSTNWLRCPLCENIYVNPSGPVWIQAYRPAVDSRNSCHCSATQLDVQIVSPSFVREMREPNLLGIWKTALDALRQAEEWVIIGYGFPDEDLGVRALFTRAYGSRTRRPHITVVQQDESALPRYDAFFDSSAMTYCADGLDAFVSAFVTPKKRRRAKSSKSSSHRRQ
jgi:hypothetical protein